jgi:hypothetical protein
MISLPSARGMQTMAMVLLEAGEKSLDPPVQAIDGSVKGEIDFRAGGITWVDNKYDDRARPLIEPLLPSNRNVPIGFDLILRATQSMRDSWYLSKLRLPMQTKTAFETQVLVEEWTRENLALFSPWETGLHMLLEEVFWVAMDVGAFGEMRAGLDDFFRKEGQFSFQNPLRNAIERNRLNQANQILPLVAGIAQFDQMAPKFINFRNIVNSVSRGSGAPEDWLNDVEVAEEAITEQQDAQSFLTALGTAGQVATIAKDGAQAAATLTDAGSAEAADESFVYGPA